MNIKEFHGSSPDSSPECPEGYSGEIRFSPDDLESLKSILTYDSEVGRFTWNRSGKVAGSYQRDVRHKSGRIKIYVLGRYVMAHRLAWLFFYGQWPNQHIDHIDGDGANNAIANLRCVTIRENQRNRRMPCTNRSGVVGVNWHTQNKKWQARINVNGRNIHLGIFEKIEDAKAAREEANKKYDFHPLHGTKKKNPHTLHSYRVSVKNRAEVTA